MAKEDLTALVSRAQSGDREAFDQLVVECQGDLLSFILARLGERLRGQVDADDILQETLLRAFQGLVLFEWRGDKSLSRWLCGIAEHLIWNTSRKRQTARLELSLDRASQQPTPGQRARREERFERLEEALSRLPPAYREAIRLARIEGLKIREVAERLGQSQGAVKQLLARGLRELKDSFGETESLHLPDRRLGAGGSEDEL